jgi:predicted RNase H-like HicB family nuclease
MPGLWVYGLLKSLCCKYLMQLRLTILEDAQWINYWQKLTLYRQQTAINKEDKNIFIYQLPIGWYAACCPFSLNCNTTGETKDHILENIGPNIDTHLMLVSATHLPLYQLTWLHSSLWFWKNHACLVTFRKTPSGASATSWYQWINYRQENWP